MKDTTKKAVDTAIEATQEPQVHSLTAASKPRSGGVTLIAAGLAVGALIGYIYTQGVFDPYILAVMETFADKG